MTAKVLPQMIFCSVNVATLYCTFLTSLPFAQRWHIRTLVMLYLFCIFIIKMYICYTYFYC